MSRETIKVLMKMETVRQKMAELCEAVKAKGGNVIIIGDVEDAEDARSQYSIGAMQGKGHKLAMDMARMAHRKGCEPIRDLLKSANTLMDIAEKVTEVREEEAINETTEEE